MKIVTGKTGTPHVTSRQFRGMMEGIIGQDSYIITHGENLEPELVTNNKLKIKSGMMCHHGNISTVEIGTYDEVTIQNGTQGMKRIDLIVNRYSKAEGTGIEENNWVVIQGTPAAEDPVAPEYTEGNLQEGDLVDDCPVFEAHLDGINVTEIVKLLDVSKNMSTLNADLSEFLNRCSYSDSGEIETNETWVDGKKIYRRTLIVTDTISPGENIVIPLSLTGIADRIWVDQQNSYIRTLSGDQSYPLPLPRYSVNSPNYIAVWVNSAGIRIYSDSGWNQQWEKCVTVRYTKK
ncbi:MAG: hypothetical protein KHY08_10045 [Lachnospiraceae bacterium]|nr:hypothetical protein [Lachnospiraceae bacterium]